MIEPHAIFLSRKRNTLQLTLRLYRTIGGLIFIGAIIYLGAKRLNINLDENDQSALAIGISGLLLAVTSKFMADYLKSRSESEAVAMESEAVRFRLVSLWSAFETVASSHLGEDFSDRPVPTRNLIYRLFEGGALTLIQAEDLEQALEIRNLVAHSRGASIPPKVIEQTISKMEEVLLALQKSATRTKRRTS